MSSFGHRGRSGEKLLGAFSAIPHPVAVEIVARSGFDFLCIDREHTQIGRERIEDLVRAADCGGTPAMVRVPGHGAEAIASALDAGAAGVLVPRISTAAQARAAVAATRYPPEGQRGAGPGRATRYGYDIAAYIARANETLLLAIQVETAEGVENIGEIAAVTGVDLIFIGPGDLAVSLGSFGPGGQSRLEEAMRKVIAACRSAGRTVGLFRPSTDDLNDWVDEGVSFFIVASDAMLLGAAAADCAKAKALMA